MKHWLLNELNEERQKALMLASRVQLSAEFQQEEPNIDFSDLMRTAQSLELALLDMIQESGASGEEKSSEFRRCASDAFKLYSVCPHPQKHVELSVFLLKASCLGILGDRGADASRWLGVMGVPEITHLPNDWRAHAWLCITGVWLRLIRKSGWSDRDAVLEIVASLRDAQIEFESKYFESLQPAKTKWAALELIGLYHLAKVAEDFALFMTDGVVEGKYQVQQMLDVHFDRVKSICENYQLVDLHNISRLLEACAEQMVQNSIWTVTRAVNSKVTKFVESLVSSGRGDRAIFAMLPPQRAALAERGLLGSSRRSVVVSLPTSSGKTLIAEFRILQALNQYDHERGWVAYLAPTRALVNQVARQLRKDFEPLGVAVERVSPALEIDNVESELLKQKGHGLEFRVLVTTPEKLDLMLRQGWESQIGRPLTLVVVDEAHNIQDSTRGLKLELLLATINNECKNAQFLMLTPFIDNAREVSRWLGGANSDDIGLSIDWQPNDRAIGVVRAVKGQALAGRSFDYSVTLETVHTSRNTLVVDEFLELSKNQSIASTFRIASNTSTLAAVTAQALKGRGPVIVMHERPDWVWSLAARLKIDNNRIESTEKTRLVQEFLALEMGSDFPLIELISYGIGVHHAGLSDDVRALMEWLLEENELSFLVSTTTIAQGVNFPVTGVVLASHQYPSGKAPYRKDMPPEDFWNIAGRAGRVSQGNLGVIALVANSEDKAGVLKEFIKKQAGNLNSALIEMAMEAEDFLGDLGRIVYSHPEWSTFVQYLSHTYRQMGKPENFADEIEIILRGTLGFGKLRRENAGLANKLLEGIYSYSEYLQEPGQPLKLVDSTGFSLQSIKTVLTHAGNEGVSKDSWSESLLFSSNSNELQKMMGLLLRVPELRQNLEAVTGGDSPDGGKLALIIKDWVNGETIPEIARRYFLKEGKDFTAAMTDCGRNLHGKLAQTAAWGLGALLSITGSEIPEERLQTLSNLPSRVFYGVNDDDAIVLRLLGVPRMAAPKLAKDMGDVLTQPLPNVRAHLKQMTESGWKNALGDDDGATYHKVWRILEGVDPR